MPINASQLAKKLHTIPQEVGERIDLLILKIWESPALASYLLDFEVSETAFQVEFLELPSEVASQVQNLLGPGCKVFSYSKLGSRKTAFSVSIEDLKKQTA